MLTIAFASVPLLIWLYLIFGRGFFWQVRRHLMPKVSNGVADPRIVAVVPARNEAQVIGRAMISLLAQRVPVVLVDDGSTDGTADAAIEAARQVNALDRLTVIRGTPVASGWTGKLWAMSQGVEFAESLEPDYFLFTDADIHHDLGSIAQLAAFAEANHLDLASNMVKLACATGAEKALIPAFVFFFLKLYPPAWIVSQRFKTAGAAGGCILIRREVLQKIGSLAAIRGEIIDDCALARAVKCSGGRIWMGLSSETGSIRSHGTFSEIGRMISRTAFNQLHHSPGLLAGTVIGLFFTYLLPPMLLFTGHIVPAALGALAWLLMSFVYLPMVRFYKRSPAWSLTLPFVALFYLGATVHSAFQYWRGRSGVWKGRIQDV